MYSELEKEIRRLKDSYEDYENARKQAFENKKIEGLKLHGYNYERVKDKIETISTKDATYYIIEGVIFLKHEGFGSDYESKDGKIVCTISGLKVVPPKSMIHED